MAIAALEVAPGESKAVAWATVEGAWVAACDASKGVSFAPAVDLDQLDFTLSTNLVNRNFSNYSAWHLRTLLQQQQPAGTDRGKEVLVSVDKELEWVQQGIYTEPNDQSVWLYHHWLTTLNRGTDRPRITHCALHDGKLLAFFSSAVCCNWSADGSVTLRKSGAMVPGTFVPLAPDTAAAVPVASLCRTRPLPGNRRRWALAWRFVAAETTHSEFGALLAELSSGDADLEVAASFEELGTGADGVPLKGSHSCNYVGVPVICDGSGASFSPSSPLAALAGAPPDPTRKAVLEGELARVEELLDIEPDCKWALLSRGRLAAAVASGQGQDAVAAVEESCIEGYERISALDPLRRGFYEEAKAACRLRLRVQGWLVGGNLLTPLDASSLALRHPAPTALLAAFGVRKLTMEGNDLQELGPILLLHSLEELRLSRNQLVGDVTEAFVLPRLQHLDVSQNRLGLKGVSGRGRGAAGPPPSPPSLAFVDLSGNTAILNEANGPLILSQLLAKGGEGVQEGWSLDLDVASGRCVCSRRT